MASTSVMAIERRVSAALAGRVNVENPRRTSRIYARIIRVNMGHSPEKRAEVCGGTSTKM